MYNDSGKVIFTEPTKTMNQTDIRSFDTAVDCVKQSLLNVKGVSGLGNLVRQRGLFSKAEKKFSDDNIKILTKKMNKKDAEAFGKGLKEIYNFGKNTDLQAVVLCFLIILKYRLINGTLRGNGKKVVNEIKKGRRANSKSIYTYLCSKFKVQKGRTELKNSIVEERNRVKQIKDNFIKRATLFGVEDIEFLSKKEVLNLTEDNNAGKKLNNVIKKAKYLIENGNAEAIMYGRVLGSLYNRACESIKLRIENYDRMSGEFENNRNRMNCILESTNKFGDFDLSEELQIANKSIVKYLKSDGSEIEESKRDYCLCVKLYFDDDLIKSVSQISSKINDNGIQALNKFIKFCVFQIRREEDFLNEKQVKTSNKHINELEEKIQKKLEGYGFGEDVQNRFLQGKLTEEDITDISLVRSKKRLNRKFKSSSDIKIPIRYLGKK